MKSLIAAIKASLVTRAPAKGPVKKGKRKGRREDLDAEVASVVKEVAAAEQRPASWGPLEPFHQVLEPLLTIFRPFISSQVIITALLVMLLYTWTAHPRGGAGVGLPGYSTPQRLAAYEEMWRREESDLWEWLEDRVGLDHLYAPSLEKDQQDRQKALDARSMSKKLENERMSQRKMDDAIRVTEERLTALKDAVARKKSKERPKK